MSRVGNWFRKRWMGFKKKFVGLDVSKLTLTLGSAFVSFIIGLRLMEVITFDTEFLTNSTMLLVLGTVLLNEALKTGWKSLSNTSNSILIALGLSAYITGTLRDTLWGRGDLHPPEGLWGNRPPLHNPQRRDDHRDLEMTEDHPPSKWEIWHNPGQAPPHIFIHCLSFTDDMYD